MILNTFVKYIILSLAFNFVQNKKDFNAQADTNHEITLSFSCLTERKKYDIPIEFYTYKIKQKTLNILFDYNNQFRNFLFEKTNQNYVYKKRYKTFIRTILSKKAEILCQKYNKDYKLKDQTYSLDSCNILDYFTKNMFNSNIDKTLYLEAFEQLEDRLLIEQTNNGTEDLCGKVSFNQWLNDLDFAMKLILTYKNLEIEHFNENNTLELSFYNVTCEKHNILIDSSVVTHHRRMVVLGSKKEAFSNFSQFNPVQHNFHYNHQNSNNLPHSQMTNRLPPIQKNLKSIPKSAAFKK